ncbi:MAG TPA: histidine kinase dimerization/phospho-acceptor domain-containing protein, partial [Byssovorax sp.]
MRFPRGALPLLPIAPAIVVILGVAAVALVALIGIVQLQRAADEAAALRADALAVTLATRLGTTPAEDRAELIGRAARRSAAEILTVDRAGQLLLNETFGAPTRAELLRYVAARAGETRTALGRARFAVRPVPGEAPMSIVTFVAAPSPPPGSISFVNAVAALTVLLLGIAVPVAVAFTKDARDDVLYVTRRIADMARLEADPAGEPVPIRSLDQLGVLTAAFDVLVGRFAAAERSYRADLSEAASIDRERAAFLAGLSHELRTPLNAILGFAHVLESEVDGPLGEEEREYVRIIGTSGEHLRTLIDDVLDLSALETGQLKLSRKPTDLVDVAEEVVREASATARDKPIELLARGERGLFAFADRARVRQILTNLVS